MLRNCFGKTIEDRRFELEHLGFAAKVPVLKEYVRKHAKQSTVLLPKAPEKRSHRNKGWKLYVNAKVERETRLQAIR